MRALRVRNSKPCGRSAEAAGGAAGAAPPRRNAPARTAPRLPDNNLPQRALDGRDALSPRDGEPPELRKVDHTTTRPRADNLHKRSEQDIFPFNKGAPDETSLSPEKSGRGMMV